MCVRNLLGRKRASQGPILFSGTVKRQRTADPIKNVRLFTSVNTICVYMYVCHIHVGLDSPIQWVVAESAEKLPPGTILQPVGLSKPHSMLYLLPL